MSERRRHHRYAVSSSSEVSGAADPPFVVEVVNVSENGLGIVGVKSMSVGDTFRFRITGWTGDPLKGVVRWIEGFEGPIYAGVEFVDMNWKQAAALRELVSSFDAEDWGGA